MAKKFAKIIAAISCFSVNALAANEGELAHVAPATPETYPLRVVDRPSVMPIGTMELGASTNLTILKKAGQNDRTTTIDLDAHAAFGIVNELQGSVSYDGLRFNDPNSDRVLQRIVTVGLKFHYLSLPHTSGSIEAKLPIHILDDEILQNIKVGLPLAFYNQHMAVGLFSDLFELKMRKEMELHTKFKIWYGVQFTDNLWIQLDSILGQIDVTTPNGQKETTWSAFWKKLPLDLTATYAFSNAFDVGLKVGAADLFHAADNVAIGFNIAYRVGRLF